LTNTRKVHVLPCGYEVSDKGALTLNKDVGMNIKIPYYAWLIEDPKYTIVVDTAVSVRWREVHPEALVKAYPPHLEQGERLDTLLAEVGSSTRDVDMVINTHLHYDHCGNNEMFPQARFLVNATEHRHAKNPGWWDAAGYVQALFNIPKLKYRMVKGSIEVTPGVNIIPTTGHSPGHQSVVVQLKETGLVVLGGDAIYLRENVELPILPGIYWNAERYANSVEKLKYLVEVRKATLLLSHSPEYMTPKGWQPLGEGIQTFE
jgi:N-acyl homoserine lactone hydrolase